MEKQNYTNIQMKNIKNEDSAPGRMLFYDDGRVQCWSGDRVPNNLHDFDVAVSFNGKDRHIVEEKVREMTQAGIRVFMIKTMKRKF